jgi:hypothetical protein
MAAVGPPATATNALDLDATSIRGRMASRSGDGILCSHSGLHTGPWGVWTGHLQEVGGSRGAVT